MTLLDGLLGKPLASGDEEHHKVGVGAGVPLLGLDALASSAYGPEATLTVLLPMGAMGLAHLGPVMGIILSLLGILYLSYRQTIAAYPGGGGSYTVAKENMGIRAGLLAAASLLIDYVLTAAVGISAGVGALVSAVPALLPYRLLLCLAVLVLITVVNLRGIKESGVAFAAPTYLFIGSLSLVLLIGGAKVLLGGGHPTPLVPPAALTSTESGAATLGTAGLWLLVRAFASGCTAMTGVEAVSNGVTAFAAPAVKNAQRTLTLIVALLAVLLAGITWLCHAYGVGATDPEGANYQSVLSQLVAAIVGRGVFYCVTLGSVLAVLALSANTGFADFPRLCRLIAEDDYLPHAFANRGRRLVYSLGISILAAATGLLLIAFGGVTDRLIPLFAVGAFGAFTLSQAGMVVHWRRVGGRRSRLALLINAFGALATAVALVVILVAKFAEGAWVTLLLIPLLLTTFMQVKAHYVHVARLTASETPLDLSDRRPPLVIVPISHWSDIARNAIAFALRLSPEVIGVHVRPDGAEEGDEEQLYRQWEEYVAGPARATGLIAPELRVIPSPYRRLFTPLMREVLELQKEHPDRTIAVIIPELVESRWWEYLLHNQRATGLKAALLLRGGPRLVVINVPWYLGTAGRAG